MTPKNGMSMHAKAAFPNMIPVMMADLRRGLRLRGPCQSMSLMNGFGKLKPKDEMEDSMLDFADDASGQFASLLQILLGLMISTAIRSHYARKVVKL